MSGLDDVGAPRTNGDPVPGCDECGAPLSGGRSMGNCDECLAETRHVHGGAYPEYNGEFDAELTIALRTALDSGDKDAYGKILTAAIAGRAKAFRVGHTKGMEEALHVRLNEQINGGGFLPPIVEIDLAKEGKAIAVILSALDELTHLSVTRVLQAVESLIPRASEGATWQERRSNRVEKIGQFFGTGPGPEDDVP